MEMQGEYETPENVRTLPVRGFAQIDNDYFDRLMGVVSPTGYYCLMYLVRRTLGYNRKSVRVTLDDLQTATGLSRHTVLKALDDLARMRIVCSDASERGRTQVRTFTMLPIEDWCLDSTQSEPDQISAKNALVEKKARTSAKTELVRAKTALVEPETSAKNAPLLNTEREIHSPKTERENDAVASSATASAARSVSPKPSKSRKLTDEQLAAHRQEAVYIADVLTRYRTELHVSKLPAEGQQRNGARWFYTAGLDGSPVPPDDVMQWYRLTKSQPFWRGTFLSLMSLQKPYTEHAGDIGAYRSTIAQKGAHSNGHAKTQTPIAGARQPDWKNDGKYAAFVDDD
jgi:phage replication O-like protein O